MKHQTLTFVVLVGLFTIVPTTGLETYENGTVHASVEFDGSAIICNWQAENRPDLFATGFVPHHYDSACTLLKDGEIVAQEFSEASASTTRIPLSASDFESDNYVVKMRVFGTEIRKTATYNEYGEETETAYETSTHNRSAYFQGDSDIHANFEVSLLGRKSGGVEADIHLEGGWSDQTSVTNVVASGTVEGFNHTVEFQVISAAILAWDVELVAPVPQIEIFQLSGFMMGCDAPDALEAIFGEREIGTFTQHGAVENANYVFIDHYFDASRPLDLRSEQDVVAAIYANEIRVTSDKLAGHFSYQIDVNFEYVEDPKQAISGEAALGLSVCDYKNGQFTKLQDQDWFATATARSGLGFRAHQDSASNKVAVIMDETSDWFLDL